jgi:hypothetical protein
VHLYLNAFKNDKTVFWREPAGGGRGTVRGGERGMIDVKKFVLRGTSEGDVDLWPGAELHRPGDEDETNAKVTLPRDVGPGESVVFEMEWDSKLPAVVLRTGYDGTFHLVGQWFPKIARLEPNGTWASFPFHHLAEFYADYGTYDVTLDVPASFTIGATGPTVESHVANGRRVERHVQSDVHDFAWSAWDLFQSRSAKIGPVTVTLLYPKGYGGDAGRELRCLEFALPYYGERYGAYPYDVLTVVHPPETAHEAGGMEYPTLITTGGPWYGPPRLREVELLTIHEFGHQYFYGLLATNEVEWPFLDEGLNSYAEGESMARWLGPGNAFDAFGLKVSDVVAQGVYSNRFAKNEPVAQPAYAFRSGTDYGALVYSRTAGIFETLRRVYGDERMAAAMGLYARTYRFEHPGPAELLAVLGEVLGESAAKTTHAALFDRGWVDYELTGISNMRATEPTGVFDRDGKRETVTKGADQGEYEGWVLVTRRGNLPFPVDVDLILAGDKRERRSWDGVADAVRIPYRGPSALVGAIVDPEHKILIDENMTNNHAVALGEKHAGTPRVFERLAYWTELLLDALVP